MAEGAGTRLSVVDYVVTDDLSGIFSAGVATREQADISSDHRALFVRVDAGPIEATRRKNGRARRRDAVSRCPYSRRRLREAPEEVNELVTREIERRIADGQISRAQCMEALCELFNRALTTSRCPAEWALAFVVPLFKKGCPYSWTNYRCISLLSVGTSAQNETPFGLSPASIFGRSNVDHAQRYVSLLWSRLRDDYTYYF